MVPGFSSNKLGYFQNIFFNINENKLEINYLTNYIFVSAFLENIFYLEIDIAIRQVNKRFIKLL